MRRQGPSWMMGALLACGLAGAALGVQASEGKVPVSTPAPGTPAVSTAKPADQAHKASQAAPATSVARKPRLRSLVGHYAVSSTEGYTGSAIIERQGGTYVMQWLVNGNQQFKGVALRTGGVLSVAYEGEDMSGVIAYRIVSSRRLVGSWAVAGQDGKVYQETLTRVRRPVAAKP